MQGMHYNPEFFPDSERYDPERFSEENKRNIPPCTYFLFGEGPHICIGENMDCNYRNLNRINRVKYKFEFLIFLYT